MIMYWNLSQMHLHDTLSEMGDRYSLVSFPQFKPIRVRTRMFSEITSELKRECTQPAGPTINYLVELISTHDPRILATRKYTSLFSISVFANSPRIFGGFKVETQSLLVPRLIQRTTKWLSVSRHRIF